MYTILSPCVRYEFEFITAHDWKQWATTDNNSKDNNTAIGLEEHSVIIMLNRSDFSTPYVIQYSAIQKGLGRKTRLKSRVSINLSIFWRFYLGIDLYSESHWLHNLFFTGYLHEDLISP